MSERDALDKFGDIVISGRDEALVDILQDLQNNGSNVSGLGSVLRQSGLSPDVVTSIIDHVLFKCLSAVQEAEFHGISVEVRLDDQNHDIALASDGLAGELFGDRGWIATKSKYPASSLDIPR